MNPETVTIHEIVVLLLIIIINQKFKMKYLKIITLLVFVSTNLNAQNKTLLEKDNTAHNRYAIKNVNIIPMTKDNNVIENATIVIEDNKIASINSNVLPKDVKVIDGTGKWLIPGLIDMHVHTLAEGTPFIMYPTKGPLVSMKTQNIMTPYIANGVTTIFELSARPENIGQRNEIIRGGVIGPRIALAKVIGGKKSNLTASNPSDGRNAVRLAKEESYEFIKAYTWLNEETFKAVVDEAQKQNMKVVGHIPNAFEGKPAQDFFIPHFGLIAHAEELSKQTEDHSFEKAQEFARLAKENGTWLIPNLTNMVSIRKQAESLQNVKSLAGFKYVHPLMQSKWLTSNSYHGASDKLIAYYKKLIDFHILIVKAFKEAGVPMVAGTDAGISGIVSGFSLHGELKLLVEAGLTNNEALASATRLAAEWLEINDKIGTIEIGKFADIVMLDQNPLDDINNTRKISGVFVNGNWIDKNKLDTMLSDVEKWNNANKENYNWKELLNSLKN
ncbi:amidohydrolase family protein [Zhouia amylolytica]|uniref:Amidohydrolase, imidazolonepropionase n=1 Tax=Zhouia amylolytica AD3 TaxID=1286632 RepID=W2USC5_9FLAO|nr:amidohydrolase family protein [Zhouia amylolytica]ETN96237.1 amidohydrolase, imidazolonepropionase [Zhouia amylolytica AD3]